MNVLYKYVGSDSIVKILESLELKLPNISDVNDPYECFPVFYCPDDKPALKKQFLQAFDRNHLKQPVNWEQISDELYAKGEIQDSLVKGSQEELIDFNQNSCLLSVSKTARNPVMWAHYSSEHEGAAIGIDFNNIYQGWNGVSKLVMHRVNYSKKRIKINVLSDTKQKDYEEFPLTKSIDWKYEKEFRSIFRVVYLELMQQRDLVDFIKIDGKDSWVLRLNPESIKEVVFGLNTKDDLKADIRKLKKERQDLQHIQLRQATLSETYDFDINDII
ncbi:DUF2971 domain-containing protein [Planctomycetota bacterium]